jgi:hypothetical protein
VTEKRSLIPRWDWDVLQLEEIAKSCERRGFLRLRCDAPQTPLSQVEAMARELERLRYVVRTFTPMEYAQATRESASTAVGALETETGARAVLDGKDGA